VDSEPYLAGAKTTLPGEGTRNRSGLDSEPKIGQAKTKGPKRAHGAPVADTKGKKGMQGKETVGVLPLRCGALYVNTSTQRPELRDREYNLSV